MPDQLSFDADYDRGWRQMTDLIESGKSWSGRERNCCFLNMGSGRFADVSAVSGLDFADDGRTVIPVDWDFDGDLDLWLCNRTAPRLRLMRNDTSNQSDFVALKLTGRISNRDAIGARVEVKLRNHDAPLIRTLSAGNGFLSQSGKWLHFGLGQESEIEHVHVRWPGGKPERFDGIRIGGWYVLEQGTSVAAFSAPADFRPLDKSPALPQTEIESRRVFLPAAVQLPNLEYLDNEQLPVPLPSDDRIVLLNLWATWCIPCLAELADFSERHEELQAAGIDVVALSVDGLRDGENLNDGRNAARKYTTGKSFPFACGFATTELLDRLDVLNDVVTSTRTTLDDASSLPVPTSLLIDASGRLSVIYKGRIDVDQLLTDAAQSSNDSGDRLATSLPFPGRWLTKPSFAAGFLVRLGHRYAKRGYLDEGRQYLSLADDLIRANDDLNRLTVRLSSSYVELGNACDDRDESEAARSCYEAAVRLNPQSPSALTNLGNSLFADSQLDKARQLYERAVEAAPDLLQARFNLGTIALQQADYSEAERQFRHVLRIQPGFAPAVRNLAAALEGQGKTAAARELMKTTTGQKQ